MLESVVPGFDGISWPHVCYTRHRCEFEAADVLYEIVGEEGDPLRDGLGPPPGTDTEGTALAAAHDESASGSLPAAKKQRTVGTALAATKDEPAVDSEPATKKNERTTT